MSGFGEYPAEYNSKIHGAYDPGKFYGKGNICINAIIYYCNKI